MSLKGKELLGACLCSISDGTKPAMAEQADGSRKLNKPPTVLAGRKDAARERMDKAGKAFDTERMLKAFPAYCNCMHSHADA